jgi:NADH:ubiquinone oxidoreductase subunit 6 (subunit J)
MMVQQAMFVILAALALAGAVGVVAARSVFVSALWLILSFIGVAGLYVLLQAGFLAAVQILIYVGAVSVLILFTVMLTRQVMGGPRLSNSQWYLAIIIGGVLFGLLGILAYRTAWPVQVGGVLPASGGDLVIGADAAAAPGSGLSQRDALSVTGAQPKMDQAGHQTIHVPGPVAMLGTAFVTTHLLAFELISGILLVALMGAVIIARE